MIDRYIKKTEIGNYYLVGLVFAFILMVLLPNISSIGLIGYVVVYDTEAIADILNPNSPSYQIISNGIYVCQTVGYVALIGIFAVLFKQIFIEDAKKFKKDILRNIIVIVVGAGLMYGLTELANLIIEKLNIPSSSQNQDTIVQLLKSPLALYMVISAVLLAPVVEEMIFRKLLFETVEQKFKWHKAIAIVISTLIFSLIHMSGEFSEALLDPSKWVYMLSIIGYLPLALVLSLGYTFSKNNIYTVIAIHLINNLIAVVQILTYI